MEADGANWVSSKSRLQLTFKHRKWADHLTSTTITKRYTNKGNVRGITATERWENDEIAAIDWIATTLPNVVWIPLMNHTTVKEIWDTLVAEYEDRSEISLIDLDRQMTSKRCGEDDNVRDHINELVLMREKLASMGETITDRKFGQLLLGSMPPSYASVRTALSGIALTQSTKPTTSIVTKLIIDEYESRQLDKKVQDEALSAETQKKKGKKKDVECFNCHKKGHTKAECWAAGGGNEGGGPKKKDKKGGEDKDKKSGKKAEVATAEDSHQDIEAWAAIESDEGLPAMAAQESDSREIFDSGASRHMSPFRTSFVTYRSIKARPITAANKNVFNAIGIGDLIIKVPNGAMTSKILLRDAYHAPDLALMIVSVGRILDAGYSVDFDMNT